MSRIYLLADVENPDSGVHLVKANSQAQAVGHVVRNRYTCRAAKADDVVSAMSAGVKLEDATADTTTAGEGSDNE